MSSARPNRFCWSAGGLAGAAAGASLWMPATALASGWASLGVFIALANAALILVSAYLLWRQRERISAFQGLMVLLGVGFLAAVIFFAVAVGLDLPLVDRWPGGRPRPALSYAWVLLLYPALAAWFWFQNHQAGKRTSQGGANEHGQ